MSSIISAVNGGFPNFAWWTLVFMFFCIVGVTVTVASDAERTYHVAVSGELRPDATIPNMTQIVGFLASALVFNTSSVNSLVYSPKAPFEAAAAGYILLSMITVSQPPAPCAKHQLTTIHRLCGSSTTAPSLRLATAHSLTRMPCTRSIQDQDPRVPFPMATQTAQRLRSTTRRLRCTPQPS